MYIRGNTLLAGKTATPPGGHFLTPVLMFYSFCSLWINSIFPYLFFFRRRRRPKRYLVLVFHAVNYRRFIILVFTSFLARFFTNRRFFRNNQRLKVPGFAASSAPISSHCAVFSGLPGTKMADLQGPSVPIFLTLCNYNIIQCQSGKNGSISFFL